MDTKTASESTATAATTEPDLLKLATAADAAVETDQPATSTATAPQKTDGTPTDEGESAKTPGDKSGTEAKPEGKTDAKTGDESEFSKAKKEADRRDRSWKALDAEKNEFRAEKNRMEAEVQGLRREMATLRQQAQAAQPAKDHTGATAADYDQLAAKYDAEGNEDLAKAAKERANALRQKATSVDANAPAGEPWKAPEFQAEWQRNVQAVITADPTLADPKNRVVGTANNLVNDPNYGRFFRAHPDGIKAAVEVAKIILASAEAGDLKNKYSELETQSKKDRAELARLNGLLQPRGSHPSGPPAGAKSLEEMTDTEAEAFVRRAAAEADRGAS